MSVTVRRAVKDDLHPVCDLLARSTLNARWIPTDVRRRMFEPRWGGKEDYFGYLMEEDDGDVVGFLGLLFTEQTIAGVPRSFCELHSWYVEEAYRDDSLRLFLPVVGLRNTTLVNYTPTQGVYDVSVKFGFENLETKLVLVYPVPSRSALTAGGVEWTEDRGEISASLRGEAKRVLSDHLELTCRHLLLRRKRDGAECYVLWKRMQRRWFEPFGRFLYVSNPSVLVDALPRLRLALCARHRLQCLVLNHRDFETASIPFSRVIDREVPSLMKSKHVKPEETRPIYTLPLLVGYRLH